MLKMILEFLQTTKSLYSIHLLLSQNENSSANEFVSFKPIFHWKFGFELFHKFAIEVDVSEQFIAEICFHFRY